MVINKGNRISWSAFHDRAVKDFAQIVLRAGLARIMEVVMEGYVKECQLRDESVGCSVTRKREMAMLRTSPSNVRMYGLILSILKQRQFQEYTCKRRSSYSADQYSATANRFSLPGSCLAVLSWKKMSVKSC